MIGKESLRHIRILLKEGNQAQFNHDILELQPYDLSTIYQALEQGEKDTYLAYLEPSFLVLLVQELPNEDRIDVLENCEENALRYILDHMDIDDVADLFDSLPDEQKNNWLHKMKRKESKTVQSLLNYPEKTAGRLMTDKFIRVADTFTVDEAVRKMKKYATYSETINYLYVVDTNSKLVGVVSHRDLILAEEQDKLADIMYTRVISTSVETDQEEVATLIERYDFLALPVIEQDGTLVGIITIDDAMDVLIEEANEDFEKMSATGKDIDVDTKAHMAAVRRLPWLLLLLGIGVLTGAIVSQFENTIQQVVILTYFMPMIAGMTGNTGTQSLALAIRGIAQREMDGAAVRKLLIRDTLVGLLIGTVCGIAVGLLVYLWQGNVALGLVIGFSLFVSLLMGTIIGTIIPFLLRLIRVDPAIASGPLITTLNDVISLCVYFGLATYFLHHLV